MIISLNYPRTMEMICMYKLVLDKKIRLMISCLWFFFLLFNPVQAFEITSLTIEIQPTGDAAIGLDYSLSMVERIGAYLGVADPGLELKKALESNFHKPVTVDEMSDHSVRLVVQDFAKKDVIQGTTQLSTPELRFTMAEKILEKYWFARILNPDYSPHITTITYPDGHVQSFSDLAVIPATTHTIQS